jgi:hypothetical protein
MNEQANPPPPPENTSVEAAAALSICESLLIALSDLDVITDKDAHDVLLDAAATHRTAAETAKDPHMHTAVADLIEVIMNGQNSVRKI